MQIQAVLDLARLPLNDVDKIRYLDADLLKYANHALLGVLRQRPDLFLGSYESVPVGVGLGLSDTFPLPDEYAQVIADYVTARAETLEDEAASSARAAGFFTLFGSGMNG